MNDEYRAKAENCQPRLTLTLNDDYVTLYCNNEQVFRTPKDKTITLSGVAIHKDTTNQIMQLLKEARIDEINRMPATNRAEILGYRRDRINELKGEK